MTILRSAADLAAWAAEARRSGKSIALVPTMGGLHAGQEALVRAAAARADLAVVSIVLNPLQFGPNESIATYPRNLEEDLALCRAAGAGAVFAPPIEELFPRGYSTFVGEETLSKPLCGVSRPTHFRGFATLLVKLFNLVRPNAAFFGEKTVQRAAVARKVSDDLNFGVEIVVVPTVREADGLAAGVHNRLLTAQQRQSALALSQALRKAKEMADAGVRSPDRVIAEATHILSQHRRLRVVYVAVVDERTMEPAREIVPGRTRLAIAAWVDETRLIDNVML